MTPTGSFSFTYDNSFKLKSETLDWLVHSYADTAYIQGTASIRNDGVYPFRVEVRDGRGTSADYLLLEVCGCNDATETGPIIYRASGYVGGQIHVEW
jgi:hypothetical protein